jgi:hypothetical protein
VALGAAAGKLQTVTCGSQDSQCNVCLALKAAAESYEI